MTALAQGCTPMEAKVILQINHAGGRRQEGVTGQESISPSGIREPFGALGAGDSARTRHDAAVSTRSSRACTGGRTGAKAGDRLRDSHYAGLTQPTSSFSLTQQADGFTRATRWRAERGCRYR